MTLVVTAVLLALTAYFSWLAGRRWERGRIELERAEAEEIAFKRSQRPGTIRMNTMRIRR